VDPVNQRLLAQRTESARNKMIHQHTMTQLKTVQDPMRLLSSAVITSGTSLTNEVATTTQPATPTSNPGYVVVPASSLNYIKIAPYVSSAANSLTIRVTGWSKTSDTAAVYVPQVLFQGTISAVGANSTTSAGTGTGNTLYPAATIAKTYGDAKIYNSATSSCGFILVDTLGSQFIKIEIIASSAVTYNAFIGAI
jgi:hypothetical protein